MSRTQLRDLLISALSFSDSKGAKLWEKHLVTGFDAFLGGEDVFDAAYNDRPVAYMLATIVERSSVRFAIYCGGSFHADTILADRVGYVITGKGLSVRYLRGDHEEVRGEIADGYHAALDHFGADAFREMFNKMILYSAINDASLLDVDRGVVESILIVPGGVISDPLRLEVPRVSRLRSGTYYDLRSYDNREDLVNGVYGAWTALVSSREQDWARFLELIQPVFGD
ncbi:MAG: hypothetical protein UY31_C0057G0007 [Candidatus Wolfebacteria bacterium GW2011_GWE1_48_7]|nr:MAG: hypothetical protein UY00_C0039G0006 [Candidatus Wolfebacteria bacterium GW2011_GWA1_47_6]KKU98223.1 MAG: hypothetical protein UY31_C0057G0007 [Candidatus Wolfebacteria bacterium GW2011_GWE1_48_7]HAL24662.1 hypothetical protein [Candidatus Wolfebacteria bacterium]HBD17760.1 hypothetical protein [Candidatus Wolfebacteria bacterium]HBN87331.1 hypothetical protein [Candidatus Wolfebacteria bacterium]